MARWSVLLHCGAGLYYRDLWSETVMRTIIGWEDGDAQGQLRPRHLQAGHFAILGLKMSEERAASLRGISRLSCLRTGDDLIVQPT